MSVPPLTMPSPITARVDSGRTDQAARLRAMTEERLRSTEGIRDWKEPASEAPRPRRPRVVAIGSGKGGVGKTAIAVNLSIALARRGLRVTLVDGDLGTPNIDVVCGLSPRRRLDAAIRDPLGRSGAVPFNELSIATSLGFRLVPGAAASMRAADLGFGACRELAAGLVSLAGEADIVIVDAGAGIGVGVRSWLHAADLPLIVATPEPASIADAYGLLKCLKIEDLRTMGEVSLVLNQVGGQVEVDRVTDRLGSVTQRFLKMDLRVAGSVYWDRDMILAARTRVPLLARPGKSRARQDVGRLAAIVVDRLGVQAREGGAVIKVARGGR